MKNASNIVSISVSDVKNAFENFWVRGFDRFIFGYLNNS